MDPTLLFPPMMVSVGKPLSLLPLTSQVLKVCISVYRFITSRLKFVFIEPAML